MASPVIDYGSYSLYDLSTNTTHKLGIVEIETHKLSTPIFKLDIPLQDTTQKEIMQLMGAWKTINITGRVTNEWAEANGYANGFVSFINSIELLQTGNRFSTTSQLRYNSDLITNLTKYTNGYINVGIENFDWKFDSGDGPVQIKYSLSMTEGKIAGT